VRVYERFADSRHRAEMEEHFSASELAVLAAYSDDELTEVVRDKTTNPSLTREQLKQLLKARQALDHLYREGRSTAGASTTRPPMI
jgi:DNA-binding IclR family transcriptional regulator